MFNWRIPFSDGTYKYECSLLKPTETEDYLFGFFSSIDSLPDDIERFSGSSDQWVGAQYYELIESKNKFQTYYTLLAWDGNDLLTNKKMIDVLWFDDRG